MPEPDAINIINYNLRSFIFLFSEWKPLDSLVGKNNFITTEN